MTSPTPPASGAGSNPTFAATLLQGGESLGESIGPYKLLQVLGEGGMGTVYMAEQTEPVRRRVALKVIKQGLASPQILARFEAERQALALMDHANIATVLDAGCTETGRPYFAMELVHGVPITDYCDEHQLPPRERLEVFLQVCHAIQHAHQKGIIHRDIKPSNILVTRVDGKPVPKVIDFGVAKAKEQLTARTMYTQYGAVVGTLEYMSPEQADMSEQGVDTRSDIYSLGVVLYELLTGATPMGWAKRANSSLVDMLRMIREVEPSKPSTQLSTASTLSDIAAARHTDPHKLPRAIKGELDWVVMKCLEKDRSRRYESVNNLARDIERYLNDETLEACPPSASYRLRRFVRKHRGPLAAAALFVLLLAASAVVSTWQALRARAAEQIALQSRQEMAEQRDRARRSLSQQVAERLDGDVRRLATAGEVIAAAIAQNAVWQEPELEAWMRSSLEREPSMFAVNVGFEPQQFDAARDDYDLYLFRGSTGIEKKYLVPPGYLPVYREWDWYKDPKQQGRSLWSEPYVDTGGGEVPMVTYTVPLLRAGEFIGVFSLDLSVDYFKVLRAWLTEVRVAEKSYGFIVSGQGQIISHPDAEYDFESRVSKGQAPLKVSELAAHDAQFQKLAQSLLEKQSGAVQAVDPMTGKPSTFLYAPVASANWMFVVVIEE